MTGAPGPPSAEGRQKGGKVAARDLGGRGGGCGQGASPGWWGGFRRSGAVTEGSAPEGSAAGPVRARLVQVPDLAEQRGQPRVLGSPRHQHLRVGMVEGAQFCEAPDEAGEVLGVLRMMDLGVLVEEAQERLLQLFDVPLVPQERAVCRSAAREQWGGAVRCGSAPEGSVGEGGQRRGRITWKEHRRCYEQGIFGLGHFQFTHASVEVKQRGNKLLSYTW